MTQSSRIRTKSRWLYMIQKKSENSFCFEWWVFKELTTLHYLRTLIFGIPLHFPRAIYDLMGVLGLQAQLHNFSIISSAAWPCHCSSAMKDLAAMSPTLHPSEHRVKPTQWCWTHLHLKFSPKLLLRKGVSLFPAMGRVGGSMGISHGISRLFSLSVNWDSRAAVPVL